MWQGFPSSSAPEPPKPPAIWPATSAGTETLSPMGRSSTPSPHGAGPRWSTTSSSKPNRYGLRPSIRKRGGRSGSTKPPGHGVITKPLDAQEARAKEVIAGEKKAKATRFVTVAGDQRTLDEASLTRARALVGLKGYVTNIDAGPNVGQRGDGQIPRTLARGTLLSDVQDRPTGTTDLPPRTGVDRGAPEHRVHRPGRLPRHPGQDRPCHRQRRQATPPATQATITINGTSQTFPPQVPDAQAEILAHLGIGTGH